MVNTYKAATGYVSSSLFVDLQFEEGGGVSLQLAEPFDNLSFLTPGGQAFYLSHISATLKSEEKELHLKNELHLIADASGLVTIEGIPEEVNVSVSLDFKAGAAPPAPNIFVSAVVSVDHPDANSTIWGS